METGIVGRPAPQLEHVRWIDENGDERSALTLAKLGAGFQNTVLLSGLVCGLS
jgi:hypothetical protein